MFDFKENIEKVRENYKTGSVKSNERLPKPLWMSGDRLNQIYIDKKAIFQNGNIYYGSLVQANMILFRRYPALNCPADIVYSTDPYFDDKPQELAAIARKLFSYKNKADVPNDIRAVVTSITSEMDRIFNLELPHSITDGRIVYFTTIMVFRKHIPKKRLIGSIFPILAQPETLKTTLILPHNYWTDNFKKYYCQE